MLTHLEMHGDELRVTIFGDCDSGTVRACIRKFLHLPHIQIRSLHITISNMQKIPACALGLMLWLEEKSGAACNRLSLIDCDIKLWKMLGMTEILEGYFRRDVGDAEKSEGAADGFNPGARSISGVCEQA